MSHTLIVRNLDVKNIFESQVYSQDKSWMYVPMFKIEACFVTKVCFKILSKSDHGD